MSEVERLGTAGFIPRWVWREHAARYQFAAQFVRGKVVVDAACGVGAGSKIFAEEGAERIEAFDRSDEALRYAAQNNYDAKVRYRLGDCLRLDLPDRTADLFISLESIEHIQNDSAFLAEAVRVLKPDGSFVCSTPNRTLTNPGTCITDAPLNPFHVREYSRKEFENLLGRFFRNVKLFGQNPVPVKKNPLPDFVARFLPLRARARLNQIKKIPRLLFDQYKNHQVLPCDEGFEYEYLVALCSEPCGAALIS